MTLGQETLPVDFSRHAARGGLLAVIAQLVRICSQLAITAVLVRLLAPGDFGIFAMASGSIAFVLLFSELGLSIAVVQQKEIDHALITTLFYVNLAASLVVMVITMAAAPLVAWFFGDPRIAGIVIAMAAVLPVGALSTQHAALLAREMRWGPVQWIPILAQLAGGLGAMLLAWKGGAGHWALVAQFWITTAGTTIGMWCFCRWRPGFRIGWPQAGSALRFGANLTSYNVLNYFQLQFDNILIGWRWGAQELGYYTRAYQLMALPLTLVQGPVGSAVVPALSRLQDEPERWRRAFLAAFAGVTFASSGITAWMIATADPLVTLLFGKGWEPTAHIFAMLSISMFAATPIRALDWVYMSLGRAGRLFRWSLVLIPAIVLGFWLGLPFGARGVAIGYSAAMLCGLIPSVFVATRGSPISARAVLAVVAAMVGPAVVAAAVGRYVLGRSPSGNPFYDLLIVSAVTAFAYVACCTPLALAALKELEPWHKLQRYLKQRGQPA